MDVFGNLTPDYGFGRGAQGPSFAELMMLMPFKNRWKTEAQMRGQAQEQQLALQREQTRTAQSQGQAADLQLEGLYNWMQQNGMVDPSLQMDMERILSQENIAKAGRESQEKMSALDAIVRALGIGKQTEVGMEGVKADRERTKVMGKNAKGDRQLQKKALRQQGKQGKLRAGVDLATTPTGYDTKTGNPTFQPGSREWVADQLGFKPQPTVSLGTNEETANVHALAAEIAKRGQGGAQVPGMAQPSTQAKLARIAALSPWGKIGGLLATAITPEMPEPGSTLPALPLPRRQSAQAQAQAQPSGLGGLIRSPQAQVPQADVGIGIGGVPVYGSEANALLKGLGTAGRAVTGNSEQLLQQILRKMGIITSGHTVMPQYWMDNQR